MITYELAKKLKEKGFPQATGGFYYWNRDLMEGCDIRPFYDERIITHTIKIPILSELIEACGDKFHQLTYFKKHNLWGASAQSSEGLDLSAHKTAEIAVANLWLQLHK